MGSGEGHHIQGVSEQRAVRVPMQPVANPAARHRLSALQGDIFVSPEETSFPNSHKRAAQERVRAARGAGEGMCFGPVSGLVEGSVWNLVYLSH